MKINFRKVASVLASVVMLGSTVGIAAAATYPAPFVQSSGANVGVVVGANAAYSDWAAAVDVSQNLQLELAKLTATSTTGSSASTSGGDSYKIEKTSTKFHLGDSVLDVVSGSVTNDNLPTLLADGTFMDKNNDEFAFTQKITLADSALAEFVDDDYKADTPALGVKIADGAPVLNYTLEFSTNPNWLNLETSDITLMGKQYYILDAVNGSSRTMTLLDSAVSDTITDSAGDTKTLTLGAKTYAVSINYVSSTKVKLTVNGETTKQMDATDANTYKLSDGTYVGIKEINYNAKETGVSNVEFSLGSGKLYLQDGSQDVELNDDAITNLQSDFVSSADTLQKIVLIWKADGDQFAADGKEIAMPGFGAVKLSWGGMTFPASETISVKSGGDDFIELNSFPLKTSTEDIALLYFNSTDYTVIGKDATHKLRTGNDTSIVFNDTTDEYFIASWTDGKDAESYLMRATNFITEDTINKTTIQYKSDGSWVDAKAKAKATDTISLGNVDLTVGTIDKPSKAVNITGGNTGVSFNTLYSKEGMRVLLPYFAGTGAAPGLVSHAPLNTTAQATYRLVLSEEDENNNIGLGGNVTVTLSSNSDKHVSVSGVEPSSGYSTSNTGEEIGNTNVFQNYVYSALATDIKYDSGGDQDFATLVYHGGESYGNIFLNAPNTVVTGAGNSTGTSVVGSLGSVTVTDAEASKVASNNLIVIGGSCINTVAAKLLGGAACGADFTTKTGAEAGSYVVQSIANPDAADKIAVIVAGYDAADTVNAAKWLTTGKPDLTVGKKYKGTTATSATAIVA